MSEEEKNLAYWERNQLVAYLSKLYPSWLEKHPAEDTSWLEEWRTIVFVETPEGQCSWHIHDSELDYFGHLPWKEGSSWDGHSRRLKYERLQNVQFKRKGNFAVIYRAYLKAGKEEQYEAAWRIVANYFVERRGAMGSSLHQTEDGLWVAYSRWPDQKTRDASWPGKNLPSNALPQEIREAIVTIQDSLDPERSFPDICMQVVEDV